MANFIINIEDIEGLKDYIDTITQINYNIINGPLEVNYQVVHTHLDVGYAGQQHDSNYALNVNGNSKIVNNVDIHNNLNVLNNTYLSNNLVVLNMYHIYFYLIHTNTDSTISFTNVYSYIDHSNNVYMGISTNGTVCYIDPVDNVIKTMNEVEFYNTYTYTLRHVPIIGTVANTTNIRKIQQLPFNFVGNTLPFNLLQTTYNNVSINIFSVQHMVNDVSCNIYYDPSFCSLVYAEISNSATSYSLTLKNSIIVGQLTQITYDGIVQDLSGITAHNSVYIQGDTLHNGSSVIYGALNVSRNVIFNSTLNVLDNVSLMNGLQVTHNASFYDEVNIQKAVVMQSTLNVSDNVSLMNGLYVNNRSDFKNGILYADQINVNLLSYTTIGPNVGASALYLRPVTTFILSDFLTVTDASYEQSSAVFNGQTTMNSSLYINGSTIFNVPYFDITSKNYCMDNTGNVSFNGNLTVGGMGIFTGNIISYSDKNIKSNITKLDKCLDKINNINGYKYNRTDLDNASHIGLIAQEVEELFPELVTDVNNIKGINYQGFIAVLLECIKELNEKMNK